MNIAKKYQVDSFGELKVLTLGKIRDTVAILGKSSALMMP